jgi:hypothetical protein
MSTIDDLFTKYLQSIMPDEPAIQRAITAHDDLRKDLENDPEFGERIVRTLLSGSYGRDTAIHGIKDVDIIAQTDLTKAEISQNKRSSETEQAFLLRKTREAIERTGRVAKTKPARRSIYVVLPKEINEIGEDLPELTLDIVPVLIPWDKNQDPMEIADRELGQWYLTYPNSQLADSVTRNQNSKKIDGYNSYKSLVKMLKAWKKVHFGAEKTPKGFVLECIVSKYHNPNAEYWMDAVEDLFDNICRQWPYPDILQSIPQVHDISDINPDLIFIAKTIEEAKHVLRAFHTSLSNIRLAREQLQTDLYDAAKTLQLVFGADEPNDLCFPLPENDPNKAQNKKDALVRIAATIEKPTKPWHYG